LAAAAVLASKDIFKLQLMKVFTTYDVDWTCQLLSKVFYEDITLGTIEDSEILFETIHDNMVYIRMKKWKYAGLISFEPYHHEHTPYDFILCGNLEQGPPTKLVPFYQIDTMINFGKNIPTFPKGLPIPSKFACALVGNPMSSERNKIMQMLLQLGLLDSWGKLFNNTNSNGEGFNGDMNALISQYKFYICFENSSHDAYLSEKILGALNNNVIPVYYGCKNIHKYFNVLRILLLEDTTDEAYVNLIGRMIAIGQNEELYREIISEPILNESGPMNSMDSMADMIRGHLLVLKNQ
jgi:hypothetical protein